MKKKKLKKMVLAIVNKTNRKALAEQTATQKAMYELFEQIVNNSSVYLTTKRYSSLQMPSHTATKEPPEPH
jgi:hypothetical protein